MSYKFEFVTAEGASCCKTDNIDNLCDHCKAVALRAAEGVAPPDSYKAGIAALRAAERLPTPPTELPLDAHGAPDPYAPGLAHMRSARR